MKQSVIGIVKAHGNDSVVLVKRRDVPIWVLPGGGIDEGETPEQAVVREVLEETGLHVKITRKVGEYTPVNRLASLTHVYECEPTGGCMLLTEETRGIGNFQVDTLPATFLFIHKGWLDDALQNLPHPVTKPLSQVTYWGVARFFLRHPLVVLRALLARLGLPLNTG